MTSNVKGVLGKKALSPNRIERIKQIVFNHFPLETGEKYEKAWSNCRRAIDENSRKLKQVENQPTKKKLTLITCSTQYNIYTVIPVFALA